MTLLFQDEALRSVAAIFRYSLSPPSPSSSPSSSIPPADSLSRPALASFLTNYDAALESNFALSRTGGAAGARLWEEKSLAALLSAANAVCAGGADCRFSCKSLLEEVGATGGHEEEPGEENDKGKDEATSGLAAAVDLSKCRLPTYSQVVSHLLSTRQLSLVGAGLVSHDEALSPFFDVADQATLGRSFVRVLLNRAPPSVAFQVDSFGHSRTTRKLLALMNFRAVVYNRVRWDLKIAFGKQRAMLFGWRVDGDGVQMGDPGFSSSPPSSSSSSSSSLPPPFISVLLKDHYNSPQTAALESSVALTQSTLDASAAAVYKWVRSSASSFPTRHLLFPVGGDNAFLSSGRYYDGLDAVIDQLRGSKYSVDARYSTIEAYLDAAQAELAGGLPPQIFEGSLASYQDQPLHSWSGFYSSRPYLKQQISSLSSVLRSAELLHALAVATTDRAMFDTDMKRNGGGDLEEHAARVQSRHYRLKAARKALAEMQVSQSRLHG